ncbi:transient receptor potential ca2 channel (trp-cc) family protein [Phytophthora cinnamomi]|uniref:transient receptor potential ca2 channel (trp-cc) family protein n=1 Tax=Phytophthora cinnamomi TaxID=4785 RepID=UPI00355982C1|nr:transient receptor potential ca2 channel (trp-cc) family protein [Phytophthora cinnamomi]
MDPNSHGNPPLTVRTDHDEAAQQQEQEQEQQEDAQTQYAKLETPVKLRAKEFARQDTFNSDAESGGQGSLASAADAADYAARQRSTIVAKYRPSGRAADGSSVRFSGADRMAHDIQLGPRASTLEDDADHRKGDEVEQSRKDTDESSKADATEHTVQMSSIELRDSVLPVLPRRYLNGQFLSNSYFSRRLLRLSQLIVLGDVVALGFFYFYESDADDIRHGRLYVGSPLKVLVSSDEPSCSTSLALAALVYHLFPAVFVLGLPASGLRIFEPFRREQRFDRGGRLQKVKRTVCLQLCEIVGVAIFLYEALILGFFVYYVASGKIFVDCDSNIPAYVFCACAVVMFWLLFVLMRAFARFREHLKMQLGAFKESDQTGDVKAHMLRSKMKRKKRQQQKNNNGTQTSPPTPSKAAVTKDIRKRLFRGAQLGDLKLIRRSIRIAKKHLGDNFARDLYPDPVMVLGIFGLAKKNPMHVAAYQGNIAAMDLLFKANFKANEKETRYEYDEDAYKNQLRMLLDGMRDEIEKRKEDNIKRNMRRAETNPMAGSGHASSGIRSRRLNHAASGMSSTNTYGMDSMKFDERALALSAFDTPNYYAYDSGSSSVHELGDDSAMPVVIGNSRRRGPPGSSRSIGSNGVFSTSQRQMRLNYDYNATNLSIVSSTSSSNSFVDDGGVSDSIVLDTGGYYFHKATNKDKPKRGGRNNAITERDSNEIDEPGTSDSIVEDLQELNTATASGEQFVFISHGDYHGRFVRKLCVEMCRVGGLRCYVDRKHMAKLSTAIDEDMEEEADKSKSSRPVLSRNEDMSVRIHEAKEAILKCSAFVVLISEKTLASELVKDQLAFAEDKGKKILPVVVNRMDFSLDIKYSLARSEFFHFFTKGDMVGFRQSLRHLLDALREEVYGISIGGPLPGQLPSFSSGGQLPSFSSVPSFNGGGQGNGSDVKLRGGFADLRDSFVSNGSYNPSFQGPSVESSMRRRRPKSQGLKFASARSDTSNFGLPPTRLSQTFAETTGTTRSITSDMSLSHSMIGNFSTLVGRIDDFDEEEELSYAGIQDDDFDSDEEVEVEENGEVRAVQEEAPSFSRAMRQHPALGALSSDGSFDTRQRGSNSSISMLELAESSETINISFDALLGDKTPTK